MRMNRFATMIAVAMASGSLAAQPEPDPPPRKPAAAVLARIVSFSEAARDSKFRRDEEAIERLTALVDEFPRLHKTSQKRLIKACQSLFGGRKRKPGSGRIYVETARELGRIGTPAAAAVAVGVFEGDRFRDRKEWASLQDALIESVGVTRDVKQVDFLVDLAVKSRHDGVRVAAGHALRHLADQPFKLRREIVERLIISYAQIANNANANRDALLNPAERTLRAIRGRWNATLTALTGQRLELAADWRKWWNRNKNSPREWGGN